MQKSLPNTIEKYTEERFAVLFKRFDDVCKQQEIYGEYVKKKIEFMESYIVKQDDKIVSLEREIVELRQQCENTFGYVDVTHDEILDTMNNYNIIPRLDQLNDSLVSEDRIRDLINEGVTDGNRFFANEIQRLDNALEDIDSRIFTVENTIDIIDCSDD